MRHYPPFFPGTVWEGQSPARRDIFSQRGPDYPDWLQLIAELQEMQKMLLFHDKWIKGNMLIGNHLPFTQSVTVMKVHVEALSQSLALTNATVGFTIENISNAQSLTLVSTSTGFRDRPFTSKLGHAKLGVNFKLKTNGVF